MIRRMSRVGLGSAVIALLCLVSAAPAPAGPKRPKIMGVASFAVRVADMAEARTFYSDVIR